MKKTVLYICMLLSVAGCTRRDLLEKPHGHTGEGGLKINLAWKGSAKPGTMGFYFYDRAGGDPIYREGTPEGYEGSLPAATYDVMICNRDYEGVDLNDRSGYQNDHVEARRLIGADDIISQVDNIYGTGVSEITVLPDASVERTAVPENLVKKLTVIFRAETAKRIAGMHVNLSGAVLRKRIVDLYMSDETGCVRSDAVYSSEEDAFSTQLSTLGFKGKCPLSLSITYEDNEWVNSIPIDLTPALIDFPEEEKTLEYVIHMEDGEEIRLTVTLHPWAAGEGGVIIVQ